MDPTISKYYAIHGLPTPESVFDFLPRLDMELEDEHAFDSFFNDNSGPKDSAPERMAPAASPYRRHRRSQATSVLAPIHKALPPTPPAAAPRKRTVVRFALPERAPVAKRPKPAVIQQTPNPAASLVDESTLMPLFDFDEADALPMELTEQPNASGTASEQLIRRNSTASSSFSADSVDTNLLFDLLPDLIEPCEEAEESLASVSNPSTPCDSDFHHAAHTINHTPEPTLKPFSNSGDHHQQQHMQHKSQLMWAWLEGCH